MHDDMADALRTYRDYGSAEQQREIDVLCSPLGFRRIQLERLTSGRSGSVTCILIVSVRFC